MRWLARNKGAVGTTGLAVGPDGFALVHAGRPQGGLPELEVCEYRSCEGMDDLALALHGAVKQNGLRGTPTTCVMAPESYVVRVIDAPEVPEAELVEATRWSLRDLVDLDPTEAVVGVLPIPSSGNPNEPSRLFAVAAREREVESVVELVREAGLDPVSVEIRETALLNVAGLLGDSSDGHAFLRLAPKRSRFGVVRDGMLCMTRDLVTDLSLLESDDLSDWSEVGAVGESLLLEVQRSLDYFESHFGRVPASQLWILPSAYEVTELVARLAQAVTIPVQQIDLNRFVYSERPLPQDLQDRALAAIATTLRGTGAPALELWNPSHAPKRPPLSGISILAGSGALAGALAVVSLVAGVGNGRSAEVAASLEAEVAAARDRVAALESRAAAEPDPRLAVRIDALRSERAEHARVLEALEGTQAGTRRGLSPLLEGLARRDRESVWLQRIAIANGGRRLALEGGALDAEQVPVWLSGLSGEAAFSGKEFRTFQIEQPQDDGPGVRFSLATELEGPS